MGTLRGRGTDKGEGSRVSEAVCNSRWSAPAAAFTAELGESHFAPVTARTDACAGLSQMGEKAEFDGSAAWLQLGAYQQAQDLQSKLLKRVKVEVFRSQVLVQQTTVVKSPQPRNRILLCAVKNHKGTKASGRWVHEAAPIILVKMSGVWADEQYGVSAVTCYL